MIYVAVSATVCCTATGCHVVPAVKMTLEVLSGNAPAVKLYRRIGYEGYQLDPAMGTAQFMQKWLGAS